MHGQRSPRSKRANRRHRRNGHDRFDRRERRHERLASIGRLAQGAPRARAEADRTRLGEATRSDRGRRASAPALLTGAARRSLPKARRWRLATAVSVGADAPSTSSRLAATSLWTFDRSPGARFSRTGGMSLVARRFSRGLLQTPYQTAENLIEQELAGVPIFAAAQRGAPGKRAACRLAWTTTSPSRSGRRH